MGKMVHRVQDYNQFTEEVLCSNCGWVPARLKKSKTDLPKPRCSISESRWDSAGRKTHGLTVEEAREFRKGRSCDICGCSDGQLHVDHNHATGKIRGVLCCTCNWGLGNFKDNSDLLRKAAKYLDGMS